VCIQTKITDIQMELKNEVLTDKPFITQDSTISDKPPSLEQQPEVSRARKILLILIGILLVSN
jgi:hypothetical protein